MSAHETAVPSRALQTQLAPELTPGGATSGGGGSTQKGHPVSDAYTRSHTTFAKTGFAKNAVTHLFVESVWSIGQPEQRIHETGYGEADKAVVVKLTQPAHCFFPIVTA